jgi:hypothetical protein
MAHKKDTNHKLKEIFVKRSGRHKKKRDFDEDDFDY